MIVYHSDPELTGQLLTFQHRRESGERVRFFLAEGDSWFSIGGGTSNILMALDDDDTLIVSCASPGDTARHMGSLGNGALERMLDPRFGILWDEVLLSAGGNDLLFDIGLLIEGGNLSLDLLGIALDGIELGYHRIIETVRQKQSCRIHAHTYDYPVPDVYGGLFRAGPWVGNRLSAAGVVPRRQAGIVTHVIDALAARLQRIRPLVVHDTRATLTPGRWHWLGWQPHWRNEIHPTAEGYRLLSSKWYL